MHLSEIVYVLTDRWTGAHICLSVPVCQLPITVACADTHVCMLVWAVTSFYFWFLAWSLKPLPFGTDGIQNTCFTGNSEFGLLNLVVYRGCTVNTCLI